MRSNTTFISNTGNVRDFIIFVTVDMICSKVHWLRVLGILFIFKLIIETSMNSNL